MQKFQCVRSLIVEPKYRVARILVIVCTTLKDIMDPICVPPNRESLLSAVTEATAAVAPKKFLTKGNPQGLLLKVVKSNYFENTVDLFPLYE